MRLCFAVLPEGDVFHTVQFCTDVVMYGECRQALYCDCVSLSYYRLVEAGEADLPVWQQRRTFGTRAEADQYLDVLQARFEADVKRYRAVRSRSVAAEQAERASSSEDWEVFNTMDPGDVPY